ncbi:MAG: hypothetical protein ACJA06_000260 [Halocynthiibacter sp.]|jgi:hypothetical protein
MEAWGQRLKQVFKVMANPIALMAGFGALSIAGVLSFAQIHSASAKAPEFGPVHVSATVSPEQALPQAATVEAALERAPVAIAHSTPPAPLSTRPAELNIAIAAPSALPKSQVAPKLVAQIAPEMAVVSTDTPYAQTSDDYGYDRGNYEPAAIQEPGEGGEPMTMITEPRAVAPAPRPLFSLAPRQRVRTGNATPQTTRRKIRPTWSIGVYR